jgi:hypothetical protein
VPRLTVVALSLPPTLDAMTSVREISVFYSVL